MFSLHHHHEHDSAFVPAAEPAHSPIIDAIAQRHRSAKAKEFGLKVHGYLRSDTSMAPPARTVNSALATRRVNALPVRSPFVEKPERRRSDGDQPHSFRRPVKEQHERALAPLRHIVRAGAA